MCESAITEGERVKLQTLLDLDMKLAAAEMDRVLILEEFTSIGSTLVKLEEALEEKLEEQKKTQAAIRSNYDNKIRILRGRLGG